MCRRNLFLLLHPPPNVPNYPLLLASVCAFAFLALASTVSSLVVVLVVLTVPVGLLALALFITACMYMLYVL
jgi:hypothetical protein